MELKFHTSLSKEECIERLNKALKRKFFSGWSLVVGKINNDNIYLRRPQYRGVIFPKIFSGRLQSVINGTEIIGTLTSANFFNFLFIILVTFVFAFGVSFIKNISTLLTALVILVFAIIYFYLSVDNGNNTVDFIKKTLDADLIK